MEYNTENHKWSTTETRKFIATLAPNFYIEKVSTFVPRFTRKWGRKKSKQNVKGYIRDNEHTLLLSLKDL